MFLLLSPIECAGNGNRFLKDNLAVILNGIPIQNWTLHPRKTNGYLLWSGRIAKEKNVSAAIKLAMHLKQPLKIVGPIFNKAYFKKHVQPYLNDDIEHISHTTQQQLTELAAGASLYLATARWEEPFGLSTVEMLASGLPVVGFNTAIPPELRHENVALTVDSNNWKDLRTLVDKAKKATPESCRDFASLFDIKMMSASYAKLYKQVVNKSPL